MWYSLNVCKSAPEHAQEGSVLQTCFLSCPNERNQLGRGCCYMESLCSWGMRPSFPRALWKQTASKAQARWIVVTASSSLTALVPLRFSPLQYGSLGEMVTVSKLPAQQPLTCTWEAGRSRPSCPWAVLEDPTWVRTGTSVYVPLFTAARPAYTIDLAAPVGDQSV